MVVAGRLLVMILAVVTIGICADIFLRVRSRSESRSPLAGASDARLAADDGDAEVGGEKGQSPGYGG
jgi:hypothetical protein